MRISNFVTSFHNYLFRRIPGASDRKLLLRKNNFGSVVSFSLVEVKYETPVTVLLEEYIKYNSAPGDIYWLSQ